MEEIKFGHLQSIYCKKIIFILILGIHCSVLSSQVWNKGNDNYKEFNRKNFYWGINLGLNQSGFKVFRGNIFGDKAKNQEIYDLAPVQEGNFYANVNSILKIGADVHIITNFKLNEYVDFRILPGFSIREKILVYNEDAGGLKRYEEKISSIHVELPFCFRYKSAPYKDKRVYVMAGAKYLYDVTSNSNTRQADNLIRISPHDFQWEIGLGMQFYFPYFIFSPELKYSQGISNNLIPNSKRLESLIFDKLQTRSISLSFHFEG